MRIAVFNKYPDGGTLEKPPKHGDRRVVGQGDTEVYDANLKKWVDDSEYLSRYNTNGTPLKNSKLNTDTSNSIAPKHGDRRAEGTDVTFGGTEVYDGYAKKWVSDSDYLDKYNTNGSLKNSSLNSIKNSDNIDPRVSPYYEAYQKEIASGAKGGPATKAYQEAMQKFYPDQIAAATSKYGQTRAGVFNDGLNGPRTMGLKSIAQIPATTPAASTQQTIPNRVPVTTPLAKTDSTDTVHTLDPVKVYGTYSKFTPGETVSSTRDVQAPDAPTSIQGKPIEEIGGTARVDSKGVPQTMGATAGRLNVFSKIGDMIPYASNIANSLRRTPLPNAPILQDSIPTQKVNYDNQRVEADRMTVGANNNASRMLDENTASAMRGTNLVSNIRAKNSINEAETNTNAQLAGQSNQINSAIEARNIDAMNGHNRDLVEAQIADQRFKSENLSNAADKYIGQQRYDDAANLEREKLQAYQPLWKNSGVYDRAYGQGTDFANKLKTTNPEQYTRMYGTVNKFGGSIAKTGLTFAKGGFMRTKVYKC